MPKNKDPNTNVGNSKPKTVFAKKSFGQNFLVDQIYIDKIIKALDPRSGETIVEIGAGRGALTEKLVSSGANVLAIELDRDLIPVLHERFKGCENFALIESDALSINFRELLKTYSATTSDRNTKLVANLPYYISTAILQHLIEHRAAFSEMILMFQREVVERITAEPGSSERGFLSVMTEAYLSTEKLFDVPPAAFRPAPKIWSAVVRLINKEGLEIEIIDKDLFRRVVSAGFAQRRKTIFNNLKNFSEFSSKALTVGKTLANCEIEPSRRAETLCLSEWICLANSIVPED